MKIEEIILYTKNIDAQKQFYGDLLKFDLLKSSKSEISFKAGKSILTFLYKEEAKPSHIAFNIPSNKIEEALGWLQERVSILPDGKDLISDFTSWNAQAVYFYDADYNIIEFIARKHINIESNETFNNNSILSISEIGIVTTDIEAIYNALEKLRPIGFFAGNFKRFCALGNDEGLFILINKTIKKWHPTQEEAFTSDFIIKGDYNFKFINGEIKELS